MNKYLSVAPYWMTVVAGLGNIYFVLSLRNEADAFNPYYVVGIWVTSVVVFSIAAIVGIVLVAKAWTRTESKTMLGSLALSIIPGVAVGLVIQYCWFWAVLVLGTMIMPVPE